MSVIKVTLPLGEVPAEGKLVSFKAPCPCDQTEAIQIEGVNYTVCDALGNPVTGVGGVWDAGSIVTVVLSAEQKKAYVQNNAGYSPTNKPTPEELGVSKIQTGSYTGSGTWGSGSPNRVTFSFTPKFVFVTSASAKSSAGQGSFLWLIGGSQIFAQPNNFIVYCTLSGNTLSWYANKATDNADSVAAASQCNTSGTVYHYIAFG